MISFSLIISVIGLLMQGFSAVMIIPVLVSVYLGEWHSTRLLVICALTGFLAGKAAQSCNTRHSFDDLNRMEGMGIVAFGWLAIALLGSIPYIGNGIGFIDSFFESMSGFTTTGATIITDFSAFESSLFFYRGFTQWLGGMGILVLFVAILPHLAVSGRQLFFAETSSASPEKLTPRIQHTARNLWAWYFFLTLLQATMLFIVGMPLVESFANTFTTMAAGGFSPHPESIMGYNSIAVEWIIIAFMFLAGANFTLQVRAIKGSPGSFFSNSELKLYALIIAVSTLILTIILMGSVNSGDLHFNFRTALFQNLSILTTTGYASVDFELWSESAKTVLLVLMFIGGCSGSAGGGIKVIRLLLLIKYLGRMLLRAVYPSSYLTVKLNSKCLKESDIQPVLSFIALYFIFFAAAGTVASLLESDIMVGYTGAIATLGNIGPGMGAIGPMSNYAGLHSVTRVIFALLMWLGRLEIMALAVFLRKEAWIDSRW